VYEGEEALYNKRLAGNGKDYATIRDASHIMVEEKGKLRLRLKLLENWEEFKYFWLWTCPRIYPVTDKLIVPFRNWLSTTNQN